MPLSTAELAGKLSRMDLFSAVPAQVLLHLAGLCQIETFESGKAVFLKEDPGRSLYLILEGAARVHDGDFTVNNMYAGQCFGEMALLDDGPRSMSVSTTETSRFARIDREVFFDVLGEYPDIMQRIVGLLTRRLRQQTDKTLEQLHRREEELTHLVEQRTAELMRQMEEAENLRAKAEAEKQEAERQRLRAEQSERAEQQFLANMSHEIRTPMNAVMGMTNLLLQKSPREDQLRYLHSIRQSSEALLVILNDILDLSKIQAGKLEMEYTGLQVSAILEQVRATLQFRAEEKGLVFTVDCDESIPPVLIGDPVRLQQVLLNLAGNAVKFTEKGHIALNVRLLEQDHQNALLHFEVVDTGIGMTPDQLAVVFESFRQASSDTTRKYGGTGLGLSISKQLVERFGGSLEVQSTLGEGSVFWFDIRFPIGQELPAAAGASARDAGYTLRGLRILVAEDNPLNRVVAVETLEMLIPDVEVITAENGQQAVEKVASEAFDVVLMDVTMPVMDGLEATQLIRQLPDPRGRIPIIAFTASVTKKEVQRCLGFGMNDCVPKPFKEAELMGALLAAIAPEKHTVSPPEERQYAPDQAVSDAHPLATLEQLTGGNTARLQKYLALYLESATTALPRLESGLAAGDWEELRRVVHTLKPQFRMLGLNDLAERAQSIESQILESIDLDTLPPKMDALIKDLRQSVFTFEKYAANKP